MAFDITSLDYVTGFYPNIIINVITSLLYILVGVIIARIWFKAGIRIFKEVPVNKLFDKYFKYDINYELFVLRVVAFLIYFISIYFALRAIKVVDISLIIVGIFICFLILISIVLQVREFLPNFISYFQLRQKRYFVVGNNIRFKDIKGQIVRIGFINIKLKLINGDFLVIPNKSILKEKVVLIKNN